jgi:hypothetical protein
MKIKTIIEWTTVILVIILSIFTAMTGYDWKARNLTVGQIPAKEMLDFVGGLILMYIMYKNVSSENSEREQRRIMRETVNEVLDERKP